MEAFPIKIISYHKPYIFLARQLCKKWK